MKAAELFVKCLENEGVEYIFGVPGEENLDLMDALLDSSIQFVTCRHEQGAAFMADVYGRLTGRAGVCLATLGPGATNLITGVADANMDHAPLVAIAGQASTSRLHKESHQVLDLELMFQPITKYSSRLLTPNIIPEVVRKAFKLAQTEKTGATFIEFPENIAKMLIDDVPLPVSCSALPEPPRENVEQAAALISSARNPIILAGNGVVRARAWKHLADFAATLNIPIANTFMAKGVVPFGKNPLALGSAGLQANDYVSCGFSRADVIICVGYDLVEYHPYLWHPTRDRKIIHIDASQADPLPQHLVVGAAYQVLDTQYHQLLVSADVYKPLIADNSFAVNLAKTWADESLSREVKEMDLHVGSEYRYGLSAQKDQSFFALRGGHSLDHDGDLALWTAGVGLKYSMVEIDLAYVFGNDTPHDDSQRYSMNLVF